MTLSPDGLWWWNGTQWVSAISPDGRWRWDGAQWVLNSPSASVPEPRRLTLVPTHDTRPLQVLVLAYAAVSVGIAIFVIPNEAAGMLRNSVVFAPDSGVGDATLNGIVNSGVTAGIVFSLAWNGVVAAGALLRWRWLFYVFMIFGFLAVFSVIANLVTVALNSTSAGAGLAFLNVVTGLAYLAIAGWMFRSWRERRTAWAMQPVVV